MATITLELTPELEQQLRDETAKQGLDPSHYIVNTLKEHLRSPLRDASRLSKAEANLLQKINLGLTPEMWENYHALIAKRRAETLTSQEQATLIEISDQIEQANARRIQYLIELASLRGTSLETLMQKLGIEAPAYV
ncbi:MAG TPA: STAS/SEC14 domain-containing protein [Allocoleopsis sp.]